MGCEIVVNSGWHILARIELSNPTMETSFGTDGSETEIETSEDFYIAIPENTGGESFTVEVYAIHNNN
jgi:hypothetical protein